MSRRQGSGLTALDALPDAIRAGAEWRQPFHPAGYEELTATSLEERRAERLAELDRVIGRVDLPVPPQPPGRPPPRTAKPLKPDPAATGGTLQVVRGAWVAKWDPRRAERERSLPPNERSVDQSDVYADFSWGDPGKAIGEPWIHSWLMRGAKKGIACMDVGDLVFAVRTGWKETDGAWLKRRTIVGVWFVEATATWPEDDGYGGVAWYSQAACFPIRRFDFPVPVEATSDIDRAFDGVGAFHDRSRQAIIELSVDEALAVARVCGLPASLLNEPDPNQLAPITASMDLGPPTVVRKRILDGARATAHRNAVEKAARDLAVDSLRRVGLGVVSTENRRRLGSDLWAQGIEADGTVSDFRIEVKGLSGADKWAAHLTQSEVDAALADQGRGRWWLVIVTRALRTDRTQHWLSSGDVGRTFTVASGSGLFAADRAVTATM